MAARQTQRTDPRPDAPAPRARWWADPLLHFVVLGALLAGASALAQRARDTYRIVVTPAHAAQLARKHQLQFGAPPDRATLDRRVEEDVRDEVLFRQALLAGLDKDDEIVRRRLVQKQQFLLENLHPPAEPTPAELRAVYAAHADRYLVPARASFSHVYFAVREPGGPAAEAAAAQRAQAVLARLAAGIARAPDRGDPFPDLYDFTAFEAPQVERLFGRTPFAQAVFTAAPGAWIGPLRSAYGLHLLRVSGREPARRPPLSEIVDRVRADAMQEAEERANREAFDRLARRFTIVREDRAAGR